MITEGAKLIIPIYLIILDLKEAMFFKKGTVDHATFDSKIWLMIHAIGFK